MPRLSKHLYAWLQILRLPNLLTVPGDPLAGIFLAAAGGLALTDRMLLAPLAALFFYAFGLVLNDYCDVGQDLASRPQRPIPAGMIGRRAALATALLLAAAGLAACALLNSAVLLTGIALVVAICAYDLGLKRIPVAGPLAMGACRALSLLLGAAALGRAGFVSPVVWVAAGGVMIYVAGITAVAMRESDQVAIGFKRWLPAAAVAIMATAVTGVVTDQSWWNPRLAMVANLMLTILFLAALHAGAGLANKPPPETVSRLVGRLIIGLLPLQAALLLFSGRPQAPLIAAGLVILLWPASAILGRRFYLS